MSIGYVGALLLAGSASGTGQSVSEALSVPDLRVPAEELGDERKYFVFHKEGVSFEAAQADLTFCSRYIVRGAQRTYPSFVAWQRPQATKPQIQNYQFGLVGAAIGAIIAGPIDRSLRQSRMIRCMVPRGYARYRTSEAIWKQLNGEDLAQAITAQAMIASGPVPPVPRTLP